MGVESLFLSMGTVMTLTLIFHTVNDSWLRKVNAYFSRGRGDGYWTCNGYVWNVNPKGAITKPTKTNLCGLNLRHCLPSLPSSLTHPRVDYTPGGITCTE